MEIREWAMRIFVADTLEEKLYRPEQGIRDMSDEVPGKPVRWNRPSRPPDLRIATKTSRKRFPHPSAMHQADMRARCLHTFANHELMALEMMAWALLAFPDAPASFRRGLAYILWEEQEHFQLYSDRLVHMGFRFGDWPLNDHFWRLADNITDPLRWICMMHLSLEQANLDHAPYFRDIFQQVEDENSAVLMQQIFVDEIRHVRFGGHWLQQWRPEGSTCFATYLAHLPVTQPPGRAKGVTFQSQARRDAGLDEDFIQAMLRWYDQKPISV